MIQYPAHLPIFSCLNQCWVCWASWWNIFLSVFCIQFLFLNLFKYDNFQVGQAVTCCVKMGPGCFICVLVCHIAPVFGQSAIEGSFGLPHIPLFTVFFGILSCINQPKLTWIYPNWALTYPNLLLLRLI